MNQRKFAIVTGASTGIGLELAKLAAQDGYDLLVVADTQLADASRQLQSYGVGVSAVEPILRRSRALIGCSQPPPVGRSTSSSQMLATDLAGPFWSRTSPVGGT